MPCVIVSSCTPVSSLWNAKNWLCPTVKHLEALVSIITPINFVEVLMVITAYLYTSILWQNVVSLLSVLPRIFYLRQASFSIISLNCGSRLVDAVVIFS